MSNVNKHHFPHEDILIVDDTPSDLKFLSGALREAGYTVRPASDGELALRSVQARSPALILLDIQMSGLDGYEVCRRLKDSENTQDIPVIFISALDEVLDRVKAFSVGGVDYITKPFHKEEVLARVETHLVLQRAQKALEEKNAQLQGEIAERVRAEERIKRLSRLKENLLNPGSLDEKLKRITDGIVRIFDADFARIWLIKPGDLCDSGCFHAEVTEGPHVCRYRDRCLHLMTSSGRYTHIDGKGHRRVPFGCYKVGRVAAGDDPKYITNDVTDDLHIHDHDWARNLGLVSFAAYRLLSGTGEPIGVLALFSKNTIYPDEDALLEGLANTTAQVVQTARAEEELQTRARQQAIVADLGRQALAGTGLAALMDDAVGLVAKTLRVEFCKVLELLPDGAALLLRAGVGWQEGLVGQATVSAGTDSQAGYTLRSGEPVIVEDLAAETRFSGPPLLHGHRVVSGMSVIIQGEERPFGVMGAHTTRQRAFTQDDVHFLQAVANVLAEAIQGKRAAEALRESEEKYRLLVENANEAVVVAQEGVLKFFNLKTMEITGYSGAELAARPFVEFVHPDDRAMVIDNHLRRLAGETLPQIYSFRIVDKGGNTKWVEINAVLIDWEGQPATLNLLTDITERKRAEVALKEYSERLEYMVEERTRELREAQEQLVRRERLAILGRLAGSVAHELRNPLAAISSATYYLRMILPDVDETAREYLEMIACEVHNSEKIISDLLDFSRIQPAEREHVAVAELITRALERLPPPEEVEVTISEAPDLPAVYVDRQQMEQVLGNLVANAYQAMPQGGRLTISAQADQEQVRVSIADAGYGIAQENLAKIFEPLFTTRARGIGLGLAISRNLVEANGGSIEVESEETRGSTFTVRLPLAGAGRTGLPAQTGFPPSGGD